MTMKEVARLAGVSISTVSKIINNKDQNINPRTREKVLQIVKDYHYSPYSTIKTLANTKSFTLGILFQNSSYNTLLLNGILRTAQENGYSLLLFDSQNDTDMELKNITKLMKSKVDGVIWEPVDTSSMAHHKYFLEADIALSYLNAPSFSDSYHIDFAQMGYALTQKLLTYQHANIACLLKDNSLRSQQILEGFKQCLYDNGLRFSTSMQLRLADLDYIQLMVSKKITGVISSHYTTALSFYEELSKRHYYAPSDISLVSLQDAPSDTLSLPNISSMEVPYQAFGDYIAKHLIATCEKKEELATSYAFSTPSNFDHEKSIGIPTPLRQKRIVVIGSLNIDKFFTVDTFPKPGKTTRILNVSTSLGGKGINQAIAASKFEAEVTLIGETGNDASASYVLETLKKEGVSTSALRRNADSPTGKAYIYLEKNGESSITILSGANKQLSPEGIRERQRFFENAKYCLLSTEPPLEAIIEATTISKTYGVKNILKPAALRNIPDALLKNIDILIPNKEELATICPTQKNIEECADFFFHKGVPIVIITLGHEGCYLRSDGIAKFFPAADFKAVDTTGGADAFIGALSAFLLKGYSIEKAIQIATYAAGFCISRQGSVTSLVDHVTLESYLGRHAPSLLEPDKTQ